jgi:UPF0755 protein
MMTEDDKNDLKKKILVVAGILFVLLFFILFSIISPPSLSLETIVEVPSGATLSETSQILEDKKIIRSSFFFRVYFSLFEGDEKVVAGKYLFSETSNIFVVTKRVVNGDYKIPKVRVTFPEGSTVFDVAEILKKNMKDFDETKFTLLSKENEGFLFPDTYFFLSIDTPEEIVTKMKENFQKQIIPLEKKVMTSGHSLKDIVIMASLLEKETKTPRDRSIVSGILWKRLAIGMPLQVDAAFNYVNGKNTYNLTLGDLQIDSLYNTYKYKGLPPNPISNPGLDAIFAAIEPTETPYLYYLSEKDGTIHYAKTFEDHKKNKAKYL